MVIFSLSFSIITTYVLYHLPGATMDLLVYGFTKGESMYCCWHSTMLINSPILATLLVQLVRVCSAADLSNHKMLSLEVFCWKNQSYGLQLKVLLSTSFFWSLDHVMPFAIYTLFIFTWLFTYYVSIWRQINHWPFHEKENWKKLMKPSRFEPGLCSPCKYALFSTILKKNGQKLHVLQPKWYVTVKSNLHDNL